MLECCRIGAQVKNIDKYLKNHKFFYEKRFQTCSSFQPSDTGPAPMRNNRVNKASHNETVDHV